MVKSALPTGRMNRLLRSAALGARAGSSLVLGAATEKTFEHAAEVLGNLRGLAAKVGQMASYVDGFVPDEHQAKVEQALSSLRSAAGQSSSSAIRELVERELSGPLAEHFSQFELVPFASASIGQVHRATLLDGTAVAVKVQHPGIAEAIDSDLKNASVIERLVTMVGPRGMNGKEVFAVISARFREELDYGLEAKRQIEFAEFHHDSHAVRIPKVITSHSTARVLTSEFVSGMTLEQAAQQSPELRRNFAEALWRFVFKGTLLFGHFNADPHPGNYIFHPDGSVSFLDFGCVQQIDEAHRLAAIAAHHAAAARDELAYRAAIRKLLGLKGGRYEEVALSYSRRAFEPIFNAPYRVTRPFVSGLVKEIQTMKSILLSGDKSFVPLPANMVFLNRLQFGFYSVLARLDVSADYARVEQEFLR